MNPTSVYRTHFIDTSVQTGVEQTRVYVYALSA